MFSLTRKKCPDSLSGPNSESAFAREDREDGVARVVISEDGAIVFSNAMFRALAGDGSMDSINFQFDPLTTSEGTRYLVGSAVAAPEKSPARKNERVLRALPASDFQTLADLSEDIMLVVDESGAIRSINNAFTKIFGYGENDLAKIDFLDLFDNEDKPYIRNTIRSMGIDEAEATPVMDFQARIVTKTGAKRWIEWRQHRPKNSKSELMYCVGRDITAIREQQNALSRREKQLTQAESIGRMGHWNWTLGQDDIEWSEELYNIFGIEKKSFRPTLETMSRLVHKGDRERVNHSFQRATIGQTNYEMEFRVTRPDGEVRFIRCEGRCAREADGEVTALYGIMQDMTERILYERELKESKGEVERAYAAKTQFLANMSHELRTPLNAIIGFSEMMHRQLLGPIGTPKYLEYIQGIRESGEHLLDLISDILDMSKIEAGKYELAFEEVNVTKTIRLAMHMMESRSSDASVKIKAEKLLNDNLHIIADRRALLQVVLNILSNAVKFTLKGGQVNIECTERKDFITIKISDNGIGIPANKLANITNPFEQVSSHYTRDHEGTGLGLSITKELVEMHGGTLLIDSTLDIGTTVTVRLPYDASLKAPKK